MTAMLMLHVVFISSCYNFPENQCKELKLELNDAIYLMLILVDSMLLVNTPLQISQGEASNWCITEIISATLDLSGWEFTENVPLKFILHKSSRCANLLFRM